MALLRPPLQQQVTFLPAADLMETATFYEETLGLPLVLDQGSCRIYRVGGDAFLGFCDHFQADQHPNNLILTLVTDAVDAWYEFLIARSVPVEKRPFLNERFNIYHFFIRDPNGYLIEFQRFLDPDWPQI